MKFNPKQQLAIWVTAIVSVCALAWAGHSATYYVSTSGSDGANGSIGTPWATVTHAKAVSAAGDVVHVATGFYPERVTLTSSGTAGNLISFVGPSDRSATNWGWVLNGANYITVGWFSCSNSIPNSGADLFLGDGIVNEGHHNNIISNNVFNNGIIGIVSYDAPAVGIYATNTLIQGNTCWSNVEVGIFGCMGTGSTVRWNEVWGTMATNSRTDMLWGDADGMQLWGDGLLVESNYVHGLFWSTNSQFNSTTYTHVDGLQTWNHNRGGPGLRNSTVRGNIFDLPDINGSCMMIQCCTNTLFYNNVFRAHRPIIITSMDGIYPGNIGFYNNDVISKSNAEMQVVMGDPSGLVTGNMVGMGFTNNIFICDSVQAINNLIINNYSPVNITGGHNLFYFTVGSVGSQTAYTFDATDIRDQDPKLGNAFVSPLDFNIATNSPAIDAGVAIAQFSTDIYGTSRPQGTAWDIGAVEGAVGSTPPPSSAKSIFASGAKLGSGVGVGL
jgi:hypothetical protein